MRLHVIHTTTYSFDTPVSGLVQSLRLKPAEFEGQTLIGWSRDVTGADFGASFVDGAGDLTETASIRAFVSEVTVTNDCTVETSDLAGVLKGHREQIVPAAYLRPTKITEPNAPLRSFAAAAVEGIAEDEVLERAHALSNAVSAEITYTPGETSMETSAGEVLDLQAGVCQDITHVLISAARCVGIPARYVCGYLYTSGDDDLLGTDASHAWAELHVPNLGWVAFDPTNGICPDERYIRLGSGLDALDAAPIRGVVQGGAQESLDVRVAVQNIQQQ